MINLRQVKPIPDKLKDIYLNALNPVVSLATKMDVHPNTFTTISFLLGIVAAYLVAVGPLRLASLFILLSGICDTIDGKLARHTGKVSRFGALYDSTLDRYGEVVYFFGMAFRFISSQWYWTTVAVAIGLGGSLMVSYVRARAEGLGFECKVGIMQRPERLVLLGLGGLIDVHVLMAVLWIIAVMSNFTAVQRIVHVWKEDQASKPKGEV